MLYKLKKDRTSTQLIIHDRLHAAEHYWLHAAINYPITMRLTYDSTSIRNC